MLKRFLAMFLTLLLLMQPFTAFASDRLLTIEDARAMAIENSTGVTNTIIDKIKKDIELKQAKDAVKDARKKENTVRFSLLLNIKWPEKHAMPKEIELLMKVPNIESELEILQHQEVYETLKSQTEGETAFYDAVLESHLNKYLDERIQDTKNVLQKIQNQFKTGTGKKEDVEYVQTQLADFENDKQKSTLNLDVKKNKLGNLIGQDVRMGYSFKEYFPTVNINRRQLESIQEYARNNEFKLYTKNREKKLAETDTAEILSIYKNRYSKYIGDIESYIKSHEGKKIDYNEFIKMYNHTLTQIDSPWEKVYVINLIFFKIRIPKEWFKGEYSGTRYMEDQKYALFVSLAERDKARKAAEDEKKALEESVYQAYNTLKQMESAYENTQKTLEMSEKSYNNMLRDNTLGLVSFSSLESARDDYYTKQNSLFEMRIEYAKELSAFNLTTGGYVNALLRGDDLRTTKLKAGDSFMGTAEWFIKNDLTDYNFQFGVKIAEDYGVDKFRLYYGDIPVGNACPIDETLIHMPLTYEDSTKMTIKFYAEDQLKYTSVFDGGQYSGELVMEKADGESETLPKSTQESITKAPMQGSFNITTADEIRSEFTIDVSPTDYSDFELFYQNNSLGKAKKGSSILTLSLYFSNTPQISIKFYDGEKIKANAVLQEDGSIKFLE